MAGLMFQIADGYLWPRTCRATTALLWHCNDFLPRILEYCPGRRVAVQAGGNVGVLPALLAKQFMRVVTFEADRDNYECLIRNLRHHASVETRLAAVGEFPDAVGIAREKGNSGASFIQGYGDVPVQRIDDLDLEACDLICLDVEGYEYFALLGAEDMIRDFHPTIVIEDKGLSKRYGIAQGSCEAYLKTFGYRVQWRDDTDLILTC